MGRIYPVLVFILTPNVSCPGCVIVTVLLAFVIVMKGSYIFQESYNKICDKYDITMKKDLSDILPIH